MLFPKANVCRNTSIPAISKETGYFMMLRNLCFPSRNHRHMFNFPYCHELESILEEDKCSYDVSLYFDISALVYYSRSDTSPAIICDFCDSRRRGLENLYKKNMNLRKKLACFYDRLHLKRIKKRFVNKDVIILAITDADNNYIRSVLNKNKVFTVPNGVRLLEVEPDEQYAKMKYESQYIVFIGSLDYEPNITSIFYSLEHIWPEIIKQYPELKFRLVGRSPTEKLRLAAQKSKGVELIGPVESTDEYYLNSRCFLGPIFSGAGMKNKFLESFSTGTPVITTTEGGIGIDFISGKHGIIANNSSEIIAGLNNLLSCSLQEYKEYLFACRFLAQQYSWENVGKKLESILSNEIDS